MHSYNAVTVLEYITATADYGVAVPSGGQRDNGCGMQIHPEKSASVGIGLLREFCRSVGELPVDGVAPNATAAPKEAYEGGVAR